MEADQALNTRVKAPAGVLDALWQEVTQHSFQSAAAFFSTRQDGRYLHGAQNGPWFRKRSDYFESGLALAQASQPRDWRKLSSSLGGAYREYSQDRLQGVVPILAPTLLRELHFEEAACRLWSEFFGLYLLKELGGIDGQAGVRNWSYTAAGAPGTFSYSVYLHCPYLEHVGGP